mmetsp:Transcript_17639/g.40842  ORF Transcript_17639/g.40842 Transcript_17639/m.40842 type:complete len:544 (-) Transcript_17639:98-1729(-)
MPLRVLSTSEKHDLLPASAHAILGFYDEDGSNHDRPVFKRNDWGGRANLKPVYLFYWDDRNGKEMMGWWFGSEVGGGQVWSRSADRLAQHPPKNGWKCPVDGPVCMHVLCVNRQPRPEYRGGRLPAGPILPPVRPENKRPRSPGKKPTSEMPAKQRKSPSYFLVASLTSDGTPTPAVDVLLGEYASVGSNHGRRVFLRRSRARSGAVFLYYWDGRDGEEMSGWWFGERVGAGGVFAHAAQHTPLPPRSGWNIPHDGDVAPDFTLRRKGVTADSDMTADDRLEAARKEVEKSEALLDQVVEIAEKICGGVPPSELPEESVEAVRWQLTSERQNLEASLATVDGHAEECGMMPENPHDADFSILRERGDAALGQLTAKLHEVEQLAKEVAALQPPVEVAQPRTPEGIKEPEVAEPEPDAPEVIAARILLKPAREGAEKAKTYVERLRDLSAPWADGKEGPRTEAAALPSINACNDLIAEATPVLKLLCRFFQEQVDEAKEMPFGLAQAEVLEELVSLKHIVDKAYFEVLETKVKTGTWRSQIKKA